MVMTFPYESASMLTADQFMYVKFSWDTHLIRCGSCRASICLDAAKNSMSHAIHSHPECGGAFRAS